MGKGIPASLQKPIDSLGFGSHLAEWRPEREQGQAGQWLEQAPGFTVLSCIDLGSHVARRHDASFRALHFDPALTLGDQEKQIGWREWLRQGNLFQFLPHMLLSTPGCTGADQTSVVMLTLEPATLLAAMREQEPHRSGEDPSPAWSNALSFAERHARTCHPLLVALRPALEEMGVEPPEFGYEVEGQLGAVMAELEMAWPDRHVAVLLEPPEDGVWDQPIASWLESWAVFQADSPPDQVLASFRSAIPVSPLLASQP
jgi:DEAD/DEAH box helicase domain-containing protein